MKLKHLFIVAAAGLAFAACDNKTDNPDPDPTAPISIVWEGRDIDQRHTLNVNDAIEGGVSKVPVKINVNAEKGIKKFVVKIESDILTQDVLNYAGFTNEFDLVAPGSEDLEKALNGFKFPTGAAVKDKTELSMDITSFVPMIFLLGQSGKADFKITVTDNEGNTLSKTVQLDIVIPKN